MSPCAYCITKTKNTKKTFARLCEGGRQTRDLVVKILKILKILEMLKILKIQNTFVRLCGGGGGRQEIL